MNSNVIERFVGRESEIQQFKKILASDGQVARVFFLQGPGGIGKTWLLRRYLEIAGVQADVVVAKDLIDMYSTNNRYIDGVIASIIQQIPESEIPIESLQAYKSAVRAYEQIRSGKIDGLGDTQLTHAIEDQLSLTERIEYRLLAMRDAFQNVIREASKKNTLVLAFDTFENVQNGPVGKWLLSSDGLHIPGVLCLIASRLIPKEASFKTSYLSYWPVSKLSDEEALQLYYRYTDSQEPITEKLESYIHKLNARADGNPLLFGLATLWLTVTESDIDQEGMFSQEEFEKSIVSWLNPMSGRGSYHLGGTGFDDPMRQVLVLMAYLNRRFNRYFLQKLVDDGFVKLSHKVSVDDLWDQLSSQQPEFFYVKGRPEGEIQLHDKLAEMLRRYLFADAFDDLSGTMQRRFTENVVDWYDELINDIKKDDDEGAYNQVLRAEKLAYVLRLDVLSDWILQINSRPAEKLHRLLPSQFQEAINLLEEYRLLSLTLLGRLIVNDIRLSVVQEFPESLRYQCASIMGDIALSAYQPEDAVVYWEEAEKVAISQNNIPDRIKALLGQNAGLSRTNLQDTVKVLETALEFVSQAPEFEVEILYELGFVHSRLGDIDQAITYYEQAMATAVEKQDEYWLPTILNDLGYAKTFQGHFEPRFNYQALRLRSLYLVEAEQNLIEIKESFQRDIKNDKDSLQLELSEAENLVQTYKLKVGMTHNTLGQIYRFSNDLPKATAEYSEALSFFQEIRNKWWEADALYSRSEAHRRLAAEFYELHRLKACQDYDDRTYRDTDSSIDICERYNFVDKLATAYRRKGRLYHDRYFRAELTEHTGHYWLDQALELFDKGYEIADQQNQILEKFENLTEKAFLGDDRIAYFKEHDPSQVDIEIKNARKNLSLLHKLIEEHKKSEIQIYQYPVFIHLAELEDGALWLAEDKDDLALKSFLAGFSGLAKTSGYGQARLKQHLPLLSKILQDLEEDKQIEWCNAFRSAWNKRGEDGKSLSDTQPDLLMEVELFQSTRFMYRSRS